MVSKSSSQEMQKPEAGTDFNTGHLYTMHYDVVLNCMICFFPLANSLKRNHHYLGKN